VAPRIGNREFRPAFWPSVITIALFTLTAGLGAWQLRRAGEKRELFASYDTAQHWQEPVSISEDMALDYPLFTPLQAHGSFDDAHQILLDAMQFEGRNGYLVLTPMRRSDGPALLVNRGWLAADADRKRLPDLSVGSDYRSVKGLLAQLPRPALRLERELEQGSAPWPRVALYPDREQIESMLGYPVLDFILLQSPDEPDGYLRQWRPQIMPPERHLGYAVQWFGLALALLVIYLAVNLRRTEDD